MNHKKTAGAGFRTTAAMAGIGAMVAGAGLIGAATAIAAPDEGAVKSSTSTSASETSSTSSKVEKTDEETSTSTSTSSTSKKAEEKPSVPTSSSKTAEPEIKKTADDTPLKDEGDDNGGSDEPGGDDNSGADEPGGDEELSEDQKKFKASLTTANNAIEDGNQRLTGKQIEYAVKNMDKICKDWSSKAQCGETLATHPLGKKLDLDDTPEQLQEKVIDSKFKQPTPPPADPPKPNPDPPAPTSPSKEPEPTTRTQTQTVTERESTVERSTITRSAEPRPAEPRQTVTETRTTQRSAEPSSTSARPERPTDTSTSTSTRPTRTSTSTRPTRTSTSARPAGERTLAARPSREKEPPLVYSEASNDESAVSPWMWGLGAVLLAGFGVAGWYLYKSYKGAGSGSDGTGIGA